MKKIALLIITLFFSDLNSQKKELRQVDKLISQSFFDEALSELSIIESLVLSSEDKYKADFYFKKAKVSNELKNFKEAILSYNSLESIESSNYSNTIKIENGNLFAVLLDGNDAVTNSIELGTEAGGTGALAVQSLSGYDNLIQRGGSWTYDIKGYGEGAPLDLQLQAGDVTIDNKAVNSSRGAATFAAIKATGDVQSTITNKGDLTVEKGITGNAELITADDAVTQLDGTSTYGGETQVQTGGRLEAISAQALSAESDHQVAGTLDLGGAAQTVQSLTLDSGFVTNGTLTASVGVTSKAGIIDAEIIPHGASS